MNKLKFTSNFDEALDYLEHRHGMQSEIPVTEENREYSRLHSHFALNGVTVGSVLDEDVDIALHDDRCGRRTLGVIVLRKSAIVHNLLVLTSKFLEGKNDMQVVIVNGCNPIGKNSDEEVSDFWICLADRDGIFYAETDEPIQLFQR